MMKEIVLLRPPTVTLRNSHGKQDDKRRWTGCCHIKTHPTSNRSTV